MKVTGRTGTRAAGRRKRRAQRTKIATAIRREIVTGIYPAGALLPTRVDLLKRFRAAPATLQAAMNRLIREGFVEVGATRNGSRVSDRPPHLFRYTMVFPPGFRGYSQYLVALEQEAKLMSIRGRQVTLFDGLNDHSDIQSYMDLVEDVQCGRIAGLFFAIGADAYAGTPLLEQAGIPRFAIAMPSQVLKTPKVFVDYAHMFMLARDYLASRGRRRPAILSPPGFQSAWFDANVVDRFAEKGMEIPRWRIQFTDWRAAHAIAHTILLLWRSDAANRPDSFVIGDDNMVGAVTRTLREEGVRVPEDVDVVTHCNFPWPTASELPVHRVGFNIRRIMELAIDAIDRQRRGERVEETTSLPAVDEAEMG